MPRRAPSEKAFPAPGDEIDEATELQIPSCGTNSVRGKALPVHRIQIRPVMYIRRSDLSTGTLK